MHSSRSKVILDAHVHLYPCFDLTRALDRLWANLSRWTVPDAPDTRFLALIAERTGTPTLKELLSGPGAQSGNHWTATTEDGGGVWLCRQASGAALELIVGRQFVTREKMEVLALGPQPGTLNGLPIREIVDRLHQEGQVPILPWSPGKWLFERGRRVADLLERFGPALALCDTAIRPREFAQSTLFQRARHLNCQILAGSDPLPLSGEEKGLGTYAIGLPEAHPSADPVSILQAVLKNQTAPVEVLGHRNSAMFALARMVRYQIFKTPGT